MLRRDSRTRVAMYADSDEERAAEDEPEREGACGDRPTGPSEDCVAIAVRMPKVITMRPATRSWRKVVARARGVAVRPCQPRIDRTPAAITRMNKPPEANAGARSRTRAARNCQAGSADGGPSIASNAMMLPLSAAGMFARAALNERRVALTVEPASAMPDGVSSVAPSDSVSATSAYSRSWARRGNAGQVNRRCVPATSRTLVCAVSSGSRAAGRDYFRRAPICTSSSGPVLTVT